MHKTLVILAMLALALFAQNPPGANPAVAVNVPPGTNPPLTGNGEVVTENVQLQVEALIPQQEAPQPEVVVNIGEVVNVEQTLPPPVTIVEEHIVVEEAPPGNTIVVVEHVTVNEETLLNGLNIEEGEPLHLAGNVGGSVNGNVSVNGWSVTASADRLTIPASLMLVVVGLLLFS